MGSPVWRPICSQATRVRAAHLGVNPMQVGSSTLSPLLQALQSAALNQYQAGGDFGFSVGGPGDGASDGDGSSGAGPAGSGGQLSGSFKPLSLIAVGAMSADGQLIPFSSAQIQSEEAMAANAQKIQFEDSLQNFLTLAQAGSANGQVGPASYRDQQQFVGDNGLVSVSSDTSFSLSPSGGGQQGSPSAPTQSIEV
jgi:hypothetical protein